MGLGRQQVAIGRLGIDAGQHWPRALEDLVVQAHPNAGQVLLTVERARLLRGPLLHVVNLAQAGGHAQQVAHELHHAAIRAAADQRQRECHLAQPPLADRQLEQHFILRHRRRERVFQRDAGLSRLLIDELAAHALLGGQRADRPGSRQRPNRQVLTLMFRQLCCRASGSIHARTTTRKNGQPLSTIAASSGAARVTHV